MQYPSFFVEQWALEKHPCVAGIDEVGRGCLAGPVVAGIVVLSNTSQYIPEIRDSKQMTALQRERLFDKVINIADAWAVGSASPEEIDHEGIIQATHLAMLRAYWQLDQKPPVVLLDGEKTVKPFSMVKCYSFAKGDAKYYAISAASVVAKVFRDRLMEKYDVVYPEYGFKNHKGYGTSSHYEAIRKYGATPLHRRSFKGVVS